MSLCVKTLTLARGGRCLLRDLELELPPGEVLGILGPNGSGKSTLLTAMAGQYRPEAGDILFQGQSLPGLDAQYRPRLLGYASQAVEPAWGIPLSAMLDTALDARGLEGQAASAARMQALRDFDMEALAERPITELSGGEARRLTIAVASIGEPPLLLLDEPFAALDLGHQAALRDWLRASGKAGRTVVISLHDPNDALVVCDRVLVLRGEGTYTLGRPKDVLFPGLIRDVWGVSLHRLDVLGGAILVPVGMVER